MKRAEKLPSPDSLEGGATQVRVVADHSADRAWNEGFLQIRRVTLQNEYHDGLKSREYAYDFVERNALDAVAIVLESEDGLICMRTAIRPPLLFRAEGRVPVTLERASAVVWEVPAGLIEPGEKGESGILGCASRETLEEVGLAIEPSNFSALGPPMALCPGVIGEMIYFCHATANVADAGKPTEDGSPLEERAEVRWVSLDEALQAVRSGIVSDIKTEVAIRRLAELRGTR